MSIFPPDAPHTQSKPRSSPSANRGGRRGARTPEPPKGAACAPTKNNGIVDADPEPWTEAVDGSELLHDLAALLRQHVVMPEHAATTCALWIVHTYVFAAFTYTPRLLLSSPVKRSGKTLLLRLLAALVSHPLTTEGISAAAMYRIVAAATPTLLLDEYDTFLLPKREASESAEALRGVVNAGFQRGGRIVRCSGDNHEPTAYPCFAPVVLAGIGNPPSTVLDRSVRIAMRRRANGEQVERVNPGRPLRQQHEQVVRCCRRWAQDHASALAEASPDIPSGLHDRAADCWWSLLAIADEAGGAWPESARAAAVGLSAVRDDDEDPGIVLLRDVREVFGAEDRLATTTVLLSLRDLDGAPWATWHHGRDPITSHGLARLLRPFEVRSRNIRMPSGSVQKGYFREDFNDAWQRYLPPLPQ